MLGKLINFIFVLSLLDISWRDFKFQPSKCSSFVCVFLTWKQSKMENLISRSREVMASNYYITNTCLTSTANVVVIHLFIAAGVLIGNIEAGRRKLLKCSHSLHTILVLFICISEKISRSAAYSLLFGMILEKIIRKVKCWVVVNFPASLNDKGNFWIHAHRDPKSSRKICGILFFIMLLPCIVVQFYDACHFLGRSGSPSYVVLKCANVNSVRGLFFISWIDHTFCDELKNISGLFVDDEWEKQTSL